MFGSGRHAKSLTKISGGGAQRPADGFPRFTEDFVSPPAAEVGCWRVHQQSESYSSRSAEFFSVGSGEDPEAPARQSVLLAAAVSRAKNAKGPVNLTKGRAAAKVFSLTESEGDALRTLMRPGDEMPVPSSDSEPLYLSRVKALALKKGRLCRSGSRDLSELESDNGLTDESLPENIKGMARILSYDRHNYMDSPRQLSQEFQSARSPDGINLRSQSWKTGKKLRRAPLVSFSKCAFSCTGHGRAFNRAAESLPRQLEVHDAQGRGEEDASDYRAGSENGSNGNSLRRSFRWLYSKMKAVHTGNESPEQDHRGVADLSPDAIQRVLDTEWKKVAMEQSERMSSMLDMLRNIATKLDGIAVKDNADEAVQQCGKSLTSCIGRQPDRVPSARDYSRQNTSDMTESAACLTDTSDKNSKSSRSRPRHLRPTLLSLSNSVKDARTFLRNFSELLSKEINEVTHVNLILGELFPHVQFVKPWHLRYGLEALVCEVFFADFEREGFGTVEGVPEEILLSPDEYWVQFQCLASLEPEDATDAGHPDYDANFHWFCEMKLRIIQQKVHWIREWSNELVGTFLDAAKYVWRLHMLAMSFPSPAGVIRAAESQVFNSEEMEPVDDADGLIMDAKAFSSQVELTVMPGFRLPEGIVRCKVYLKPKSARPDKRSPKGL